MARKSHKTTMKKNKYDIFISYRREGGAQYARILQLMLQQRGYRVFLDYDELTDGIFGDHIKAAIKDAPVFMLVLSEKSMLRCLNEDDWVRQEIMSAIQEKKHIVPVNPDNKFDGFPEDTADKTLPKEIREQIGSHQHSEIGFGQTLGVTIDLMIKNRLVPTLGERTSGEHVDVDYASAEESLRRQDAHNRFMKRLGIGGVLAVILIVLGFCLWFWKHQTDKAEHDTLRTELESRYANLNLQLLPDLSVDQMCLIDTMLMNMTPVYPDSIWMSQFEFTRGLWLGLKGEPYTEEEKDLPMTTVSYGDIYMFLSELGDMTNLTIELPSAEVWEYAAHGGQNEETTLYVGDDEVDKVAWYEGNSNRTAHPSNGQQGLDPNGLDLYDMSGNVWELCNTAFDDSGAFTICGGCYDSPAEEVTVTSRKAFGTDAKDSTVGFRIIIRKD